MGREFLDLFEEWADHYDSSVEGHDEEYKEVFRGYDHILSTVVDKSIGTVLEFGVGTGNLTVKLVEKGRHVIGIEPSEPMREKAIGKLKGTVNVEDGDFINFHIPTKQVDTIVSTYAFHHLTDEEKEQAIQLYSSFLQSNGKIVFADTMFKDTNTYLKTIEQSREKGFHNLADDLQREYYTTIEFFKKVFHKHGFTVSFSQCNEFVWVMEAIKL